MVKKRRLRSKRKKKRKKKRKRKRKKRRSLLLKSNGRKHQGKEIEIM